jgi:methyl-accepting chemotaxis protein
MGASVRGIAEQAAALLRTSDDAIGAVLALRTSERDVAGQASATRTISEAVAEEARQGENAVSETIEAMGGIRESFASVEQAIGELSARSSAIGEVVEVIDEVSAESALLSLNAAIIAAQAGSQGRAFGVLADEIHGLAERTSQSNQEIAKLVRAVRGEIERSVAAVAEGRVRVERGVARSEGAGAALAGILERCGDAVERASDILRAGEIQSERLAEVERAFGSVREGVHAMGDALREHGSASAGVLRIADEVRALGEDVKKLTVAQRGETDRSARAMEGVAERTRQVRSAVDGQRESCGQIRRALDGLKGGSEETAGAARELREVLKILAERAGRLSQELERFTL